MTRRLIRGSFRIYAWNWRNYDQELSNVVKRTHTLDGAKKYIDQHQEEYDNWAVLDFRNPAPTVYELVRRPSYGD